MKNPLLCPSCKNKNLNELCSFDFLSLYGNSELNCDTCNLSFFLFYKDYNVTDIDLTINMNENYKQLTYYIPQNSLYYCLTNNRSFNKMKILSSASSLPTHEMIYYLFFILKNLIDNEHLI